VFRTTLLQVDRIIFNDSAGGDTSKTVRADTFGPGWHFWHMSPLFPFKKLFSGLHDRPHYLFAKIRRAAFGALKSGDMLNQLQIS
jgi:hypothetical protein